MAIDLPTLSAEVKLAKYAGMDQTAIAADLNARVISGDVDVSVLAIDRYLSVNGIWGKIDARVDYYRSKLAAEPAVNSAAEQKLANLRTMVRALEKLPDFQTSIPANKTAIFALIENLYRATNGDPAGEGLIDIQQRNQLRALVTGNISRVEQMFARGDRVTPEQVEQARRL